MKKQMKKLSITVLAMLLCVSMLLMSSCMKEEDYYTKNDIDTLEKDLKDDISSKNDTKIDGLRAEYEAKIAALEKAMTDEIAAYEEKLAALNSSTSANAEDISALEAELETKIAGLKAENKQKIDEINALIVALQRADNNNASKIAELEEQINELLSRHEHDFGEWYDEEGMGIRICQDCGVIELKVIDETKLNCEGNGSGTEDDPYLLKQINFADYYNNFNTYYHDKHVKMVEDIVINEGNNEDWFEGRNLPSQEGVFGLWRGPIGNGETALTGSFDGDGHTISGVCLIGLDGTTELTGRYRRIALFAGVAGGTVKNLNLVNSYFESNAAAGHGAWNETAGIAARLGVANIPEDTPSIIDNCYVDAIINARMNDPMQTGSGGIVGSSYGPGTVSNCVFTGKLHSMDVSGGILGNVAQEGYVTVKNCVNYADITTPTDRKSTGGIVGHNVSDAVTVENCVNVGNITGAGTTVGRQPGGIFGHSGGGIVTIKNCLNVGNVSNSDASLGAGGIVGNHSDQRFVIENCMNLGNAESGDLAVTEFAYGRLTLNGYFVVDGYSDVNAYGSTALSSIQGIIMLSPDDLKNEATFAQGGALEGWRFVDNTKVPTPFDIPTAILWTEITSNA